DFLPLTLFGFRPRGRREDGPASDVIDQLRLQDRDVSLDVETQRIVGKFERLRRSQSRYERHAHQQRLPAADVEPAQRPRFVRGHAYQSLPIADESLRL